MSSHHDVLMNDSNVTYTIASNDLDIGKVNLVQGPIRAQESRHVFKGATLFDHHCLQSLQKRIGHVSVTPETVCPVQFRSLIGHVMCLLYLVPTM